MCDKEKREKFTPVESLKHNKVKNIWLSQRTSFALIENEGLFVCGANYAGQLGMNDTKDRSEFIPVQSFINSACYYKYSCEIKNIWLSQDTSFVITKENDLFACGANQYGQLGLGDKDDRNFFTSVSSLTKSEVTDKDCVIDNMWLSSETSFALTTKGVLLSCGANYAGQLGRGHGNSESEFKPIDIRFLQGKRINEMRVTERTSVMRSENKNVFACGENKEGKLMTTVPDRIISRFTKSEIDLEARPKGNEWLIKLLDYYSDDGNDDTYVKIKAFYACMGIFAPYYPKYPIF